MKTTDGEAGVRPTAGTTHGVIENTHITAHTRTHTDTHTTVLCTHTETAGKLTVSA